MKPISLLLSALCLTLSCSNLPKVYPVEVSSIPELHQKCRHLFPNGKWQFLHSIETIMPNGEKGLVMGVTVISSHDKTVRCVIMTLEGLVVVDVQYDRQVIINRRVPPFDSENFAKGLIKDIQLIFFMPQGPVIKSGILRTGASICRYRNTGGRIVDIITHKENTWELRQYSKHFRLIRTVNAFFGKKDGDSGQFGIPDRLKLTAHGSPGYTLVMDLVEAVLLTP